MEAIHVNSNMAMVMDTDMVTVMDMAMVMGTKRKKVG